MGYENDAKAAAGFSAAAAIAAALALLKKPVAGQPPIIPDEIVQLLVAIAGTSDDTKGIVQEILALLATGAGGQGWPANRKYIRSSTVTCVAAATVYQAPTIDVASGMALIIKAHPLNAVGSIISVASTVADCLNPNSAYPLIPNEAVSFSIQNAEVLYVSSNVAGSVVIFSTERDK